MPAKTMLFDQRVRTLHDFGASPHNFISFNPQGRLLALAGFGNLAGKIDIFDRRNLSKVCTIDAPNTSFCEWSPDGRFLLTATLSPRLRVDNGIKIWHCSGPLMHIQSTEELYQASWRPTSVEAVPQFGQNIPPAPPPSESVKSLAAVQKPTPSKPAGAYRPPGARGLATPSIFKREDEGGAPRLPTHGAATPPRAYNRSPGSIPGAPGYGQATNGNGSAHYQQQQQQGGRRVVPGAASPHTGSPGPEGKGNKKKKGGKREGEDGRGSLEIQVNGLENGQGRGGGPNQSQGQGRGGKKTNGAGAAPVPAPAPPVAEAETTTTPTTPGPGLDSALDPAAKKIRNLNKKVCLSLLPLYCATSDILDFQLKAIDELKEKAKRGERLEATQLKKIEGEADIRKELENLGGSFP